MPSLPPRQLLGLSLVLWSVVVPTLECPQEFCVCFTPQDVICKDKGLEKIPDDLPPEVEHLVLSENKIHEIPERAFADYPKLRKVYLDRNEIRKIHANAFAGLTNISTLSVQSNPLKSLESFSFAGISNATQITLASNDIQEIQQLAFAGTHKVHMLMLNKNPLKRIRKSAFTGLRDIGYLFLPDGIEVIESEAFGGLQGVDILKLSNMNLLNFNSLTFANTQDVVNLEIQQSTLGKIENQAFEGLKKVKHLRLLNNRIDSFQEFIIDSRNEIEELSLTGNYFSDIIHPGQFICEASKRLTVDNNSFPCDCRLRSILDSPCARNNEYFLESNRCNYPKPLEGKPISTIGDLERISPCPFIQVIPRDRPKNSASLRSDMALRDDDRNASAPRSPAPLLLLLPLALFSWF